MDFFLWDLAVYVVMPILTVAVFLGLGQMLRWLGRSFRVVDDYVAHVEQLESPRERAEARSAFVQNT